MHSEALRQLSLMTEADRERYAAFCRSLANEARASGDSKLAQHYRACEAAARAPEGFYEGMDIR